MDARKLFGCMLFFVLLLFFVLPGAFALKMKGGDQFILPKGEVIADDLIVGGGEITIDGRIEGDLIAVGGNIFVNGEIEGDVIVAGGSIDIKGDISDDAILAGGTVEIAGDVGDNLLSASGTFRMGDESSVGRDAFLTGGVVDARGDVGRNLDVTASNVVVSGTVLGNVSIDSGDADAAPHIMSGARIGGNVNYTSVNDIIIDEGASVSGTVSKVLPPKERVKSDLERFNESLLGFLSIFIVGFVLVRMFPVHARSVCNTLKKSALSSGLWGIIGLIVTPFVVLLLMISIIGLPLALILLVMYIILIYVSKIYVSVFAGKYLLSIGGSKSDSLVLMLALGLLLFELIGLVPGLGAFIGLFIVIFGLGAVLLAEKEMYQSFRKKKLI